MKVGSRLAHSQFQLEILEVRHLGYNNTRNIKSHLIRSMRSVQIDEFF